MSKIVRHHISEHVDVPQGSSRSGQRDCRSAGDGLSPLVKQLARQAARETYAAQQARPLPSDFDCE
jgi:hypothetical protein